MIENESKKDRLKKQKMNSNINNNLKVTIFFLLKIFKKIATTTTIIH